MRRQPTDQRADLPLDKAVEFMLEECRMVLPGIQALFGFQMIAVFSERFDKAIDQQGKSLHMLAILFVVIAISLIMTPAALHRITDPRSVSNRYLTTSTRLILAAMVSLVAAIGIETWLVADVPLSNPLLASLSAVVAGGVFVVFWWVFPLARRPREWTQRIASAGLWRPKGRLAHRIHAGAPGCVTSNETPRRTEGIGAPHIENSRGSGLRLSVEA